MPSWECTMHRQRSSCSCTRREGRWTFPGNQWLEGYDADRAVDTIAGLRESGRHLTEGGHTADQHQTRKRWTPQMSSHDRLTWAGEMMSDTSTNKRRRSEWHTTAREKANANNCPRCRADEDSERFVTRHKGRYTPQPWKRVSLNLRRLQDGHVGASFIDEY